jgi:peptidoglycan hydrolase CwlO-like protein
MKVKNEKALIDMEIEKAQIKAAEETYKVKELELEIKRIEQQKAEREEKINRVESFKNRLRAR